MAEASGSTIVLIDAARAALGQDSPFPADRRARAAAALARTALEAEIDQRLELLGRVHHAGPHGRDTRWTSKLIALRVLDRSPAAVQAGYAWNALSSACHQHAYDLSASAAEVAYLVSLVEGLVNSSVPRGASRPSSTTGSV